MDGLAIAASLTEIKAAVVRGIIRTIYQPQRGTFVLHLFAGKDVRLLLAPGEAAIHLTQLELPYPKTPSPFVMLLRKHLRGGRIINVCQEGWERVVTLEIERRRAEEKEGFHLVAELLAARGNLILLHDGRVLAALRPDPRCIPGSSYQPLPSQDRLDPTQLTVEDLREILQDEDPERGLARRLDGIGRQTARAILVYTETLPQGTLAERIHKVLSDLLAHVEVPQAEYDPEARWATFFPLILPGKRLLSFAAALDREYAQRRDSSHIDREVKTLRAGLSCAIAKRERTTRKLREWLSEAAREEALRHCADLIMTHQSELSRGMSEARFIDPESGKQVKITLNPRLTPVENAQALYERIKRLRRGRPLVKRRLHRLELELAHLEEGLAALEKGGTPNEKAITLIPSSPSPRRPSPPTAPRVYHICGYTVQVGKDAAQNDTLLRMASPEDLWLHAKGVPGSHVIVRHRGREKIPQEVIEQAARLAATFSKAKEERRLEVSYAPVKYVRKPKGSPAGLVILTREDTLTVDLQEKGEAS